MGLETVGGQSIKNRDAPALCNAQASFPTNLHAHLFVLGPFQLLFEERSNLHASVRYLHTAGELHRRYDTMQDSLIVSTRAPR